MSQIHTFCPQVETDIANKLDFEEMLEFEVNIFIYYRFYPYGCFIFLVLCFLLTSELNYPSPDFFSWCGSFCRTRRNIGRGKYQSWNSGGVTNLR